MSTSSGASEDRPPLIVYTDHARERMKERKVQAEEVTIAISEPDEIHYGDDGELIAVKKMGRRTVEVVYVEVGGANRVITVMVS